MLAASTSPSPTSLAAPPDASANASAAFDSADKGGSPHKAVRVSADAVLEAARDAVCLSGKRCMWVCQWMAGAVGAEHFAVPVDWKALQLDDYPSIVSEPMDLQTLEHSCARADFDYAGFCATAGLIWSNTRRYNGASHPISQLADRLEALMQAKLRECEANAIDDTNVNRTACVMLPLVNALHLTNRFAIFDEPVDCEAEPNYAFVVDRPTCLTDVMTGIENMWYVSVHDIVSDLDRIATNAKAYNDASHPVHALAIDLEMTMSRLVTLRVPDVDAPFFVTGEMRTELYNRAVAMSDVRRLELVSLLRTICPDAIEQGSEGSAFILDALCLKQFVRVDCKVRAWVNEDVKKRKLDDSHDSLDD